MKIKEFIKKYRLVLFLSFLVVILIFLKITYKEENNNQTNQISPTPTPTIVQKETISGIKYEILNDGNPDYPLQKLLPYSTDNFSIIGYDDPYTLVVRIKNGEKIEVEKEIKEWIEINIPGDTDHKIIFIE